MLHTSCYVWRISHREVVLEVKNAIGKWESDLEMYSSLIRAQNGEARQSIPSKGYMPFQS